MTAPNLLWSQYHSAVQAGNSKLAQAILKKIQAFKSAGNRQSGCSSCSRKLR